MQGLDLCHIVGITQLSEMGMGMTARFEIAGNDRIIVLPLQNLIPIPRWTVSRMIFYAQRLTPVSWSTG